MTIPINNDNIDEAVERFFGQLTVISSTQGVQLRPNQTEVNILDDDGEIIIIIIIITIIIITITRIE